MAENHNMRNEQVVVSMTSFPPAIEYAEGAIRSILGGEVLPDKLVLYLTFDEFGSDGVPQGLLDLAASNDVFEIRDYPRNIRSYRKLIPALIDFPEAVIVTVDDDIAYHPRMLSELLELHDRYPEAVLAHRAKRIVAGAPYKKWHKYRWYHFLLKRIHIGYDNLQTGVGGVLYPPHSLKPDMLDPELFTRIAPTTDDIWFWAAGVANGFPVIPVPFGHNKPRDLGKPKALSLKTTNFKSGADKNSAALQAIFKEYPEIEERVKAPVKL